MPLKISRLKQWIACGGLLTVSHVSAFSQSSLSGSGVEDDPEFFVTLDAYVRYGGEIEVIDGFTGRAYHSENQVVKTIHTNFPKIMGGLHKRLLGLEALHMKYQLETGALHEEQLAALADSFRITNFKLDRETWLIKEKVILARLNSKPIIQIKELVVWEIEELSPNLSGSKNDELSLLLGGSKYSRNIRYNREADSWERRVLTEWRVHVLKRNGVDIIVKNQGLNLDTNKGFHLIERAIPRTILPSSFREVSVSYPIIVSRREDADEQIQRLQRLIVQNMSHLYDPFTWVGRRKVRFRTVFSSSLLSHMSGRNYRIKDRDWFDPVICHFLNDVVSVRLRGLQEVYDLYVAQQFENSKNVLGVEMDLLNWNAGENRKGKGVRENKKLYLKFNRPAGARFALLDMYLRYGDTFVEALRENLTSLKKKGVGKDIITQTIEEVSGHPADEYIKAALKAQVAGINNYRERKKGS